MSRDRISLKRLSGGNSVIEFVLIVAIAVGLAIGIQAFIVKPYRIPSESMYPTLRTGQRVLVDRIVNGISGPHVGEIVVFHPPSGADTETARCGANVQPGQACSEAIGQQASVNFIKRIVGGPGDTLSIRDGHVVRNGVPEKDGYIRPCGGGGACNLPGQIRIPAGHWFMMGDNRGQSYDSRFWGSIPTGWIIGGAFATYWPPKRIGIL